MKYDIRPACGWLHADDPELIEWLENFYNWDY